MSSTFTGPRSTLLSLLLSIALAIILGAASSDALNCTQQWQCQSVTTDYNYVSCSSSGVCVCKNDKGFIGNATTAFPCQCAPPNGVYWQSTTAYCIDYQTAADNAVALARTERLKETVRQVYLNVIYPTPVLIMTGQVSVAHLFSSVTKGRIDPVGTFDSYATLIEYYYGLSANPNSQVIALDFVELFGVANKVFVRVNILFSSNTGTPAFNLTQSGRYLFDDEDKISSVDMIVHNPGKVGDAQYPANRTILIVQVCSILLEAPGNCNAGFDPSGYYTDMADCIAFMQSIPFGSADRQAANNVVCRLVHAFLTIWDPALHCEHAGKTGGGKCVDTPYEDYYNIVY